MALERTAAGSLAAVAQNLGWQGRDPVDRAGQGSHIAGGHEPAGLVGDQFGYARDVGGKGRAAAGHGFHDHHRQSFGKARHHDEVRSGKDLAHAGLVHPAGQRDPVGQVGPGDLPLDLGPHGPVADQRQVCAVPDGRAFGQSANQ